MQLESWALRRCPHLLAPAIDSPTLAPSTVYVDSADYDHAGNVKSYNDQVMGKWTFTYDHLNRLASGTPTSGVYSGQNQQFCLDYDSFGNRTQSDLQTTACKPGTDLATANDSTNNQPHTTAAGVFSYDAAGDVTFDGNNDYAYDAEGRVCSMQTSPYSGGIQAYGYVYDAEGRRVAKGTVTPVPLGQAPSCNLSTNGFTLTESYTLGQGGERLTTLAWTGQTSTWQNTSVYAGGALIATYDAGSSGAAADAGTAGGLHFQLTDPLGTRRVQANSAGEAELDCQSLPFGDQLSRFPDPNAPDNDQDEDATGILTGIHFTGKERDAESGLDYFGARYYGSGMGRFMSPDWSARPVAVPYAVFENPQSLNLYGYVLNNPLSKDDPDGHWPDCGWCSQVGSAVSSTLSNPRVQLAGKAALNIAVAGVKITEAAAGAAAAPETGGLTLAVTVYQGISAAGNLAAAASQIAGAVTGDVKSGQTGADVASAATTISGVATLVATGGNVEKASQAADIENGVTTGLSGKTLFEGTKGQVATKVLDAAQSTKAAAKSTADVVVPEPKKNVP